MYDWIDSITTEVPDWAQVLGILLLTALTLAAFAVLDIRRRG